MSSEAATAVSWRQAAEDGAHGLLSTLAWTTSECISVKPPYTAEGRAAVEHPDRDAP